MFSVPSAFTRNDAAGLFQLSPTWLSAARWYTTSGRASASRVLHRDRVGDVERVGAVAVERQHVVAARLEVRDEVGADEAARAGHGDLHAVTPAASRYACEVAVDRARPGEGRGLGRTGRRGAGSRASGRRARAPVSQPARRCRPGWTSSGRVADHLGHRGSGRGDERRAARERLERGEAEALFERRVDHRLGLAEERRQRRAGEPAGRGGCGWSRRSPRPRPAPRSAPQPSRPAITSRRSGGSGARRANAAMSAGRSLRGSSVPANARYGGRMPRLRSSARSSASPRGAGWNRSWSTPCGATTIGRRRVRAAPAAGRRCARSPRSAPAARRALMRIIGVKNATLLRSCHSGWSKNVRSCTVTTAGTVSRAGIV